MKKARFYKGLVTLLLGVLIFQMAACGTLLYPERRGQKTGQIDVGVAVLDGIGLLFFILPGVVAFAVDFATGAIFLPSGTKQSPLFSPPKRAEHLPVIYVDVKDLNPEKIEAVIAKHTGHKISLNHPGLVVKAFKNEAVLLEAYEEWTSLKRSAVEDGPGPVLVLKD